MVDSYDFASGSYTKDDQVIRIALFSSIPLKISSFHTLSGHCIFPFLQHHISKL